MRPPNTFILGAPKCGTTSLAEWLDQHPEVRVSPVKEPNWFNTDIAYGAFWNEAAYLAHFGPNDPNVRHFIDASPLYLSSNEAVPQIRRQYPDARHIILLRDPARMAVSLHNHMIALGVEDEPDFAAAWGLQEARAHGQNLPFGAVEPKMLQYQALCATGSQTRRALDHLPRDRVLILVFDDLRDRPNETLRKVCAFLDIAIDAPIDTAPKNPGHRARSPLVRRFLAVATKAQNRGLLPRLDTGLGTRLRNLNTARGSAATVNPDFVKDVVRPAFAEEVSLIRKITGRPLSDWGGAT